MRLITFMALSLLAALCSGIAYSQEGHDFDLVLEIEKDSVAKALGGRVGYLDSDFWVDEDEKFLLLSYPSLGFKQTVLSIYDLRSFQHVLTTEVSNMLYEVYLDEHNVYTRGRKALGRDTVLKISIKTGSKTSLESLPPNVVEATECSWQCTLQLSELLLEASEDDDVFRIYRKTN